MKYMLLIYSEPQADAGPPDPEEMKRWYDYSDQLASSGAMISGEPLQPIETATTVRNVDGKTQTTDGPFAETKEVLGGFYLIDVADLDAALDWAARCPGADWGAIEVRPLADMPELPAE